MPKLDKVSSTSPLTNLDARATLALPDALLALHDVKSSAMPLSAAVWDIPIPSLGDVGPETKCNESAADIVIELGGQVKEDDDAKEPIALPVLLSPGKPHHLDFTNPVLREWSDRARQVSCSTNTNWTNLSSELTDDLGIGSEAPDSPRSSGAGSPRLNMFKPLPTPGALKPDYKLRHRIGEGAFGIVYSAKEVHTGEKVAVKSVDVTLLKHGWMVDQLEQEVAICEQLSHPLVTKLLQVIRGELEQGDTHVYLVMEYLKGLSLYKKIMTYPVDPDSNSKRRGLPMSLVARYLWQMLVSVEYIHSKHIVHRDVKPENFQFLSGSDTAPLKLLDFGFACRFESGVPLTLEVGSAYYMAPEITKGGGYDETVDIYGVAVCTYLACVAEMPFNGDSPKAVLRRSREGGANFNGPKWEDVPQDCVDLIKEMMSLLPSKRPKAKALLEARNAWLRKEGRDVQTDDFAERRRCCVIA